LSVSRSLTYSFLVVPILAFASLSVAAQVPAIRTTAMLDCSGLPCVEATLPNGKHLRLLIDTGNVNSTLDASVARELGLEVSAVNGPDGKPVSSYGRGHLSGVKLGDIPLGDVKLLVMDLATYIKRDRMPASDGSLAYTAFKDRILMLGYASHRVGVSEVLAEDVPCRTSCGTLTTPTFGKHGPPIVVSTGFFLNDQPVAAQIDTLFTGTMLIYPTSIQKLGLGAEASSSQKQFFKYTDDGVEMRVAKSKFEAFEKTVILKDAPVYFATPEVHLPDGMFDATVGHAFFGGTTLWLDFHNMKSWFTHG
jgi:hypothetical protein